MNKAVTITEVTDHQPWLDANGAIYSDDALKEISKSWDAQTWEKFLDKTVDVPQSELLISPNCYDFICEGEHKASWTPSTSNQFTQAHVVALEKAMRRLTRQQAQVIRFLFWEGLSVRETAKMMGVSRSLVSIQKRNSLKKLRHLIEIEIAKFPYSEGQERFAPEDLDTQSNQIREIYFEEIEGSDTQCA